MSAGPFLPELPPTWEATRSTLHAYALAMAVVARAHAVPDPRWWHISLAVRPNGLVTAPMSLPEGDTFQLRMDLHHHDVVLETSLGHERRFSLREGVTATDFGDRIIDAVASLGLEGDYLREKYIDDEPRVYSPGTASLLFETLNRITGVFEEFRGGLDGEVGPIQLWSHGFDVSFEWFGTRRVTSEEDGAEELPAQINLGFYPGGDPYFYSSPWPFDEALESIALPAGAVWHTEGWTGAMLTYERLRRSADPHRDLLDFARAVHDAAAPGLM